jgi:hypothetical protein
LTPSEAADKYQHLNWQGMIQHEASQPLNDAPVTGSIIILLLKGQIHSDGTLDGPILAAAIKGDIGGDAPLP